MNIRQGLPGNRAFLIAVGKDGQQLFVSIQNREQRFFLC